MEMEWHGYATENWLLVFSWVNHSKSAKIGTHSDFSNDPKGPWSCNTANMDLLVKHVTTHLTKCCQESFNYLNSGTLNCCGWRANTSTVLRRVSRILWKISLGTGILPQADRSQHGSTELTVYWDTKKDSKIPSDMIRLQGTFEPNSDWLPKNLAAVITQLFAWIGIQCHRTACKFLRHDVISPNIPQPFWMQLAAKTCPSSNLLVSFVLLVSGASSY